MADLNAPWPPRPKADHAVLARSEAQNFLASQGIRSSAMFLVTDDYNLPTAEWVSGTFASAFTNLLNQLGYTPISESRDCDRFAHSANWYAQYLNSETANAGEAALAFGEFHYSSESLGGHAITCAITRENGELALRFWEPQTGTNGFHMGEMKLTPEEISSCSFIRF